MNLLLETLGYGAIVPAVVAAAVLWICRRILPASAAARYALPVGLATGFFAGYVLMPDWAAIAPQRHWQWLPYLTILAATIGPIGLASGVFATERRLLFMALAIIAAFLLVPDWPTLKPSRQTYVALLTGYFVVLAGSLDSLPERLLGSFSLLLLTLCAATVTLLLAAEISLMFGQVAGIAAAALASCCMFMIFFAPTATARGLIPVFVILIGGLAFVGAIEPENPMFGILLARAAPLALFIFATGPAARLRGWPAAIAQTVAVLIPLAAAIAIVLWRATPEL